EARPLGRALHLLPDSHVPPSAAFQSRCRPRLHRVVVPLRYAAVFPPAALPALRRTYSPAYRMPFPLYGSGGRKSRMIAATWPTCPLSYPLITTLVCVSAAIVTPAGGSYSIGCE